MLSFIKQFYVMGKCGKAHKLYLNGNYARSKQLFDEALNAAPPDFYIPILHATKGEVEYKLGHIENAVASFKIVHEDFKNNPELWNNEKYKQLLNRVNYYWDKINKNET